MSASRGFTIVELLIVIVVIAILAAISVVAYNGIQDRSRTSKINSDLAQFQKAIISARINNGGLHLQTVTNNYNTSGACMSLADGADLSNKTTASACWSAYDSALNTISNMSGINIRGLVDPWGRPYHLDENEREGGAACGGRDAIAVYARPHVNGGYANRTNLINIPFITPGC